MQGIAIAFIWSAEGVRCLPHQQYTAVITRKELADDISDALPGVPVVAVDHVEGAAVVLRTALAASRPETH